MQQYASSHTLTRNVFACLMQAYTDTRLRLEIRPLHPVWRKEALYPDGNAPFNWACRTPYGVREWFPLTPTGISLAVRHALSLARTYEVYCGVLPRIGRAGKQADVSMAGWLWCDVDGGTQTIDDALQLVQRSSLPLPHLIVISGGGLHCYWRLGSLVDLPDAEARLRFKNLLKRLCNAIGGQSPGVHADCSRADTASILRVPETYNHKRPQEPRPVHLLHFEPEAECHSVAWWSANLPALPAPPQRSFTSSDRFDVAQGEGLLRWAQTPYPEGKRHKDLVSAAAWLVRTVRLTKPQAEELLLMKAQVSSGTRTITAEEIRSMVKWA